MQVAKTGRLFFHLLHNRDVVSVLNRWQVVVFARQSVRQHRRRLRLFVGRHSLILKLAVFEMLVIEVLGRDYR